MSKVLVALLLIAVATTFVVASPLFMRVLIPTLVMFVQQLGGHHERCAGSAKEQDHEKKPQSLHAPYTSVSACCGIKHHRFPSSSCSA